MKIKRNFISLSCMMSFILLQACTSSDLTKKNEGKQPGLGINATETSLSLADYLRRLPGVYVQRRGTNTTVRLSGVQTVNGNIEPLYVIDGTPLAKSYAMATSVIDVSDIDRIQVLKSNEGAAQYGMRGSNGAILIFTKKKNR